MKVYLQYVFNLCYYYLKEHTVNRRFCENSYKTLVLQFEFLEEWSSLAKIKQDFKLSEDSVNFDLSVIFFFKILF